VDDAGLAPPLILHPHVGRNRGHVKECPIGVLDVKRIYKVVFNNDQSGVVFLAASRMTQQAAEETDENLGLKLAKYLFESMQSTYEYRYTIQVLATQEKARIRKHRKQFFAPVHLQYYPQCSQA
jgi:hypothetical protein